MYFEQASLHVLGDADIFDPHLTVSALDSRPWSLRGPSWTSD